MNDEGERGESFVVSRHCDSGYHITELSYDDTKIWMHNEALLVKKIEKPNSVTLATEYDDIVGFGKNEEEVLFSFARAFVRDWNAIVECTDNLLSMETLDKKHRLIKMVKEVKHGLHEDS